MDCNSAKHTFIDEKTLEEGRTQSEGRIWSDQNLRDGKITGFEGSRWLCDNDRDFTNLWDKGRSESSGI
jgi:hypothetical protein